MFVYVLPKQELVAVHTSGVGSTDNAVCAYVEGATSDLPDTPCKKVSAALNIQHPVDQHQHSAVNMFVTASQTSQHVLALHKSSLNAA
jgi:hypothetical protein